MTIFSLNNTTAAPTSSLSFSNMNLSGSTSGIQQTSSSSVFGTTNSSSPFGASSSSSFSNMNLFGSTSGIQQTSNSSLFGTMNSSPFGASSSSFSNMKIFGSTSGIQQTSNSSVFGKMNSSSFGASNSSFSNMKIFGSTSGIQQTSNSSVFGTMNSSPFGAGPLAFRAATYATSGQTQNISLGLSTSRTFGKKYDVNSVANEPLLWSRDANVSESSILGSPRVPSFGVSSNTYFGPQRFDSYSFGQPVGSQGKESTTPLIQSSGFGKSAFGSNQKGSRTSSYIATPEICNHPCTLVWGANIQSICGMQTYKDKSHEELRFEDYQLGDKGTLAFNAAMHATSGPTQNISSSSSTLPTFEKNSNFGTPRFDSHSFGQPAVSMSGSKGKESTTPLLKISGFGKSTFGINQKGSRTTSYIATPEIGPDGAKIQSICGMQTYKDKSQEELRFEDYQLSDKEGAPQSSLCLNCLKQSQPTPPGIFNVSSTPLVASQNTPEMTPKVGATLATTNTSHPSTEGANFSEIGQGVGQQPKHQWPTVNPSPIMPPIETQPSIQISIEHPNLATSIQYGISSLPVPFFMDRENASGVPRTQIIIRNPRDWVCPKAGFPLGASSMNIKNEGMHDGDKVGDKPKLNAEEMHYDNCGDDKDVDCIMPKLQRADYYTVPPMEELISKEKEETGFCRHVKDFVVGRHGYGSIKFLGETDIRKLDLDSAVQFNHREVIIYMDERKKPPVGQGLNKPAEITLLNVRCISRSTGEVYRDGPMVNKYRDMLIKKAVEQDAEFISYDPVEGQWKFRVSHF